MADLTTALRIGTSGLQLSQLALSTISHNIVNANTTGYSRQIVQTAASSTNGFGDGVLLQAIQRVTDGFTFTRNLGATSASAYSQTRSDSLTSIENAVTNSGTGSMDTAISNLMDAMNQLSNSPADTSLRRNVMQQAVSTAQILNGINDQLGTVAKNADDTITSDLGTINQLLKQVDTLNKQIAAQSQTGGNGANANDLLDSRDQAVTELSKYFNLQVTTNTSNGGIRVSTTSGRKLVDETGYVQLARDVTGTGFATIVAQNVQVNGSLSPNKLVIDTSRLDGGEIKALVETRDSLVPNVLSQFNQLTAVLKNTMNDLSSQGSSYPPVQSLSSGNLGDVGVAADLLTTTGLTGLSGATFNISVVDSLGNPVATTVGGTPINFTPTAPATTFSLTDLVNEINNNTTLGSTGAAPATSTVTASLSSVDGKTVLNIAADNSNYKVVLSNASGNALGLMGMNNLFTGNDTSDIAVRSDIVDNPDLIPVARMNSTGGVSSTDSQNILALAQLADAKLNFDGAGDIGPQTNTLGGYAGGIVSNLAITVSDANSNVTFNNNIKNQLSDLISSQSGVNINEELSQMLVYQNSFQASARIITVVNDLFNTLMNSVQ